MKKLALLLSLLTLAALGLVACGGGDDDQTTAASETETTVGSGGEAGTVEDGPGNSNRLNNEERIEQRGNEWAAAFAAGRTTCGYMGQPACERATCEHHLDGPIENCTPPSSEFRESFADATVKRVVVSEGHHHATAEFSNGESVELEGQKADEGDRGEGWGPWAFFITESWIKNAGGT
jgi:hypothetical protein